MPAIPAHSYTPGPAPGARAQKSEGCCLAPPSCAAAAASSSYSFAMPSRDTERERRGGARRREAWGADAHADDDPTPATGRSRRGRSPSPTPGRGRGGAGGGGRSARASTPTHKKNYPKGRAPHLRLPQPGMSSKEAPTADQPLAAFAGNEQLILENFYAKYNPSKKPSEIQRELLEAHSFEQLCSQLERKYRDEKDGSAAVNPETLWDMPLHGRIGTGLRKAKTKNSEKMAARKELARKKKPSAKVAQEQRLMDAKICMKAAFYKPGIIKFTRRVIEKHLQDNGFTDGFDMATPNQIQRAKREIMLSGASGAAENEEWLQKFFHKKRVDYEEYRQIIQGNEWVVRLFDKKDRDGSLSLSFDEFRSIIRRYGKIPPREMTSQAVQDQPGFKSKSISDEDLRTIFNRVDRSNDGEIQMDEFIKWLEEQPSEEFQKFERSASAGAKTRNIRVASLEPKTRDRDGLPGKGSELKRIWKAWDANRSGAMSLAELDKFIVDDPPAGWSGFQPKDESLIIAFSYADDDWSGEVSFAEFEGLMKNVVFFSMLLDWYNEFDETGDGRLEDWEFVDDAHKIAQRCSFPGVKQIGTMSEQELQRQFDIIDEDGGGKILFAEFAKWIASMSNPERMPWDKLIDEYRSRFGKTDIKTMAFTIPDKQNKLLDRFAPKVPEFEYHDFNECIQKTPPPGWKGFNNSQAISLAFRATDVEGRGVIGRDRLSNAFKFIVYFHVLAKEFEDAEEEFAMWMARTQIKGVEWPEMETWFECHKTGKAGSGARSPRQHSPPAARRSPSPAARRSSSLGRQSRAGRSGGATSARRRSRSQSRSRSRSPSPERDSRGRGNATPAHERQHRAGRGGGDTGRGRGRSRSPSPERDSPARDRAVSRPGRREVATDAPKRRVPEKKQFARRERTTAVAANPLEALEDELNRRLNEPFVKDSWAENWSNDKEHSRDAPGEDKILQLGKLLRAERAEFEDRYFPADDSSLYIDPTTAGANAKKKRGSFRTDEEAFLTGIDGIEWKRPYEIYGSIGADSLPKAFVGDIDPDDVAQGNLGNCYFLAAIAALATQGRDGQELEDVLIKDLVVEDCAREGLFGIKFYINGMWRVVIVDDRLPCVKDGPTGEWRPIFAQRPSVATGDLELWPMLFEKAWAKLHGSYEATAGGWTDDAMNYLTGGVCRTIDFHSEAAEANDCKAEFADLVELTDDQGDFPVFLSATLNNDANREEMEQSGLITGHAYSVMEAVLLQQGERLVCLRNPWGRFEWKGAYADDSREFAEVRSELRRKVDPELVDGQEDGTFWMDFDDFRTYFWEVGVCDPWELGVLSGINQDGMDVEIDACRGEFVQGESAGGMKGSRTFGCNPSFDVVCAGSELSLTLYQIDNRRPGGKYDTLGSAPAASGRSPGTLRRRGRGQDKEGKTTFQKMTAYIVEDGNPSASIREVVQLESHQRQSASRVPVIPNKRYKVIVATWAPAVEGKFWLTACGTDVRMDPRDGGEVSRRDARIMTDRKLLGVQELTCVMSYQPVTGQYYDNPEGPVLPDYADAYSKKIADDS